MTDTGSSDSHMPHHIIIHATTEQHTYEADGKSGLHGVCLSGFVYPFIAHSRFRYTPNLISPDCNLGIASSSIVHAVNSPILLQVWFDLYKCSRVQWPPTNCHTELEEETGVWCDYW